jgi:hypothetical protein
VIIVFSSLREFRFSEEYLTAITDILAELSHIISTYLNEDKEGLSINSQQGGNGSSLGNAQVAYTHQNSTQFQLGGQVSSPLSTQNQLTLAFMGGSGQTNGYSLSTGLSSTVLRGLMIRFERLQALIAQLSEISEYHLENDLISKQAVKVFVSFLKIVFKYLENYEKMDQLTIKKIRQSLHDFLAPKSQIYGAELYLIFRAKKLLALIDSAIERNMNMSDAKISLLRFIHEIDFVLLPKRVFISSKPPSLQLTQSFLWQFSDKSKVSSLKEHIIECEVEVVCSKNSTISKWSIEAELTATECLCEQVKFKKKAIKEAKSLVAFQFLVHFETLCKHRLELSVKLINSAGFLLDHIESDEQIEVV